MAEWARDASSRVAPQDEIISLSQQQVYVVRDRLFARSNEPRASPGNAVTVTSPTERSKRSVRACYEGGEKPCADIPGDARGERSSQADGSRNGRIQHGGSFAPVPESRFKTRKEQNMADTKIPYKI